MIKRGAANAAGKRVIDELGKGSDGKEPASTQQVKKSTPQVKNPQLEDSSSSKNLGTSQDHGG